MSDIGFLKCICNLQGLFLSGSHSTEIQALFLIQNLSSFVDQNLDRFLGRKDGSLKNNYWL